VARRLAQAIGWVFVATIAYHAVKIAFDAAQAGADGNWSRAVGLAAVSLIAAAIVIAAVVSAARSTTRTR
jgi:hypothetical protein